MENAGSPSFKSSIKYWWALLLSGVLLFGAGCLILRYPVSSYVSISIAFGLLMIVFGIAHISFARANRKALAGWEWQLFIGIVDVLLGMILTFYPGITVTVLPFLLGFWFFIRGISLVSYAITLRQFTIGGWGWLLTGGILTLLFASFIIYDPLFGFFTIVVWTAFAFMATGIFNILFALRIKRKKDDIQSIIL
jgi:uncharacterized membrane protein HdeD (DUF308 family)